jgi:hypothetical protein
MKKLKRGRLQMKAASEVQIASELAATHSNQDKDE